MTQAAWSSGVRPAMQSIRLPISTLSFVGAGRGEDVWDGVRRTVFGLRIRGVDMVGKIGDDPLDRIAHFDLPAPVHHAARHVDLRERQRRQRDLLVIFKQRHSLQERFGLKRYFVGIGRLEYADKSSEPAKEGACRLISTR